MGGIRLWAYPDIVGRGRSDKVGGASTLVAKPLEPNTPSGEVNLKSKLVGFVLVAVVSGAVAACSGGSSPAQPTAAPESTEVIQAATQPAPQDTAQPAGQAGTAKTAAPGDHTFVIDPSQSAAHFFINEVLAGSPNRVDGKTDKVDGQIFASYDNPSAATVGPIKIDLTGLATDSGMRNGMIQRAILETGNSAFQYAVFTPTKCDGLPTKVTIGQPFNFKINGDLALHGVTRPVTFDTTVTPISATQLSGKASVTIQYGDWGVRIVRLPPQVASVEDKTTLELDFVANAQ